MNNCCGSNGSRRALWLVPAVLIGLAAALLAPQWTRAQNAASPEQVAKVEDLASVFRHVGKTIEPSVVKIEVKKKVPGANAGGLPFDDDMLRRFFPDRDGDGEPDLPPGLRRSVPNAPNDEESFSIGTGSGVIMQVDNGTGWILTNNHVAGGAEELDVELSDGRVIKNAKLVGADPKTDLAVVKIETQDLKAAKWGNSDELQKGDWILAFGSPFGYVGSMTHGIVSALNRDVGILRSAQGYEDFIQVDAPINPGNSGGPLVSVRGEVVGINTAILSRTGGFQGIGFAIPSNLAKNIYTQLKEHGKVTRGWLGVSISDVSKDLPKAQSFGYSGKTGVLVEQVLGNGPAKGVLQNGDIITAINGKGVESMSQLRAAIANAAPGTEMTFSIFRDDKTQDVKLKLGDQPENLMAARGGPGGDAGGAGRSDNVGLRFATLTDQLAEKYGLAGATAGAVVTAVDPRSIAARAGIGVGDLITKINNQAIATAEDAASVLKNVDLKRGVRLYVVSREGSRFVFLRDRE